MNLAHIDNGDITYDTLEAVPGITVPAPELRDGMVLLDPEFDTPAAVIDHRMRTVRGSGEVKLLVHDLDARRYTETSVRATTTVRIMAARD